jgi:2'-5' RNA ligase
MAASTLSLSPSLRLFFALWPDEATRSALAGLLPPGQSGAGRPTAPENLHLTMAFLGMQPAEVLPALEQVLQAIAFPALRLQLDRYGYFQRARIAWLGMKQPPPALLQLQRELSATLRQCGIGHDRESAFRPHVTLARNAPAAPRGREPEIVWQAPQLALVQSTTTPSGPIYQVLAQRAPG